LCDIVCSLQFSLVLLVSILVHVSVKFSSSFSRKLFQTRRQLRDVPISQLQAYSNTSFVSLFYVIYYFTNSHNYNELYYCDTYRFGPNCVVVSELLYWHGCLWCGCHTRISRAVFCNVASVGLHLWSEHGEDVYLMGSRIEMSHFDKSR